MRLYLLLFLGFIGGFRPPPMPVFSQNINCEQIRSWMNHQTDTVYLLHFWNEQKEVHKDRELAYLASLRAQVSQRELRIILIDLGVELDRGYSRTQAANVERFHFNLQTCSGTVSWAHYIHPVWTGQLPATFLCPKGDRDPILFVNISPAHNQDFHYVLDRELNTK